MATKKKELRVDELLDSFEPSTKSKETKTAKQSNNDWAEEEEESYAFGIAKDQQAASKKAQKKKAAGKGWADIEAAQQTQPKTSDFAKIQEDEQKRKIIKKPGQGQGRSTGVDIGSEAFPSLGEAPTRPAPKKTEPTPVVVPAQTDDGFSVVGPKRFINAKKKETGEHFAPLDPNIVEKPVPVAPVREKVENPEPTTQAAQPRGIFQRKAADQPAEIPADTKFKFGGGEGPKRFSGGGKISFKREEEKDDHEALRLQKEREIEEKLQKEKEEAAKQRENWEKKHHKEGTSTEHHQGHDERKGTRFSNTKKEAEKQEKPQTVPEVVESTEPKQPKESVEMHGALSNKAWGDGPILKKKK